MIKKKKRKSRQIVVLGISFLALIVCLFFYADYKGIIDISSILKPSKVNDVSESEITSVSDDMQTKNEAAQDEYETGNETDNATENVSEDVSIADEQQESTQGYVNVSLDVKVIYQYPDMPSGCEITSLTMVLNYMGIDVTNDYMADNYLDSSTYNMFTSFVGSVYNDNSFGCYAPVIVNAANKFFSDRELDYEAVNISNSTRDQIIDILSDGRPVIIWNTEDMKTTYAKTYTIDGNSFEWMTNEHCVVLSGYNEQENTVEVADSITGKVVRDADTFFQRYNDVLSQAVYIK